MSASPKPEDVQAFSDAVLYGDEEKARTMWTAIPALVNAGDESGFTALHNVMSEEQWELVRELIAQGADVNIQNQYGIAPLHLACYPEWVDLLLENGADLHITDTQGNTPLHIQAAEGEMAMDVIEKLLEKGADPQRKNQAGQSPIDIARSRKDRRNLRLLEG